MLDNVTTDVDGRVIDDATTDVDGRVADDVTSSAVDSGGDDVKVDGVVGDDVIGDDVIVDVVTVDDGWVGDDMFDWVSDVSVCDFTWEAGVVDVIVDVTLVALLADEVNNEVMDTGDVTGDVDDEVMADTGDVTGDVTDDVVLMSDCGFLNSDPVSTAPVLSWRALSIRFACWDKRWRILKKKIEKEMEMLKERFSALFNMKHVFGPCMLSTYTCVPPPPHPPPPTQPLTAHTHYLVNKILFSYAYTWIAPAYTYIHKHLNTHLIHTHTRTHSAKKVLTYFLRLSPVKGRTDLQQLILSLLNWSRSACWGRHDDISSMRARHILASACTRYQHVKTPVADAPVRVPPLSVFRHRSSVRKTGLCVVEIKGGEFLK